MRRMDQSLNREDMSAVTEYESKLIEGLFATLPDVAETCAWILGERRTAAAVAPLCDVLARRADLDDVCVAAIRALAKIGDRAAIPALTAAVHNGTIVVRLAAVVALGAIDPAAARSTLTVLVQSDPSQRVREAARRALLTDGSVEAFDVR